MPERSTNPETPSPASRGGPQSVGRIISILDVLAGTNDGVTLSELAEATAAPKTSLVGLLAGLVAEGCLVRDATSRYALGPRFLSLAMRSLAGRELTTLARPVMVDLVAATGETAVLGALAADGDFATYLDKVESTNSIRYAVNVGERRELYCTAAGKTLLAWFDPARMTAYLDSSSRQKFTETTITGKAKLLGELSRIREDGITRSYDERVMGASGIAAPIFSHDGKVIAVLLIAGPSDRMQANAQNNELLLKQAAAECTRLVGGASTGSVPGGMAP
jgi:DNA-binding IclR family transcriptional regulator